MLKGSTYEGEKVNTLHSRRRDYEKVGGAVKWSQVQRIFVQYHYYNNTKILPPYGIHFFGREILKQGKFWARDSSVLNCLSSPLVSPWLNSAPSVFFVELNEA